MESDAANGSSPEEDFSLLQGKKQGNSKNLTEQICRISPPRGQLRAYCGKVDWSFRLVKNMRVQASEAKTHLPELLDKVEQGETIVITRHGRAIARLVPEADSRQAEVDKALEAIKALRKTTKKITLEELLSSRHEGHKY